jgi:hypothetical protein
MSMTVAEVQRLVAVLKNDAHDDELAHLNEDTLRHAVLVAIAEGAPNAAELAEAALRTSDVKFARWCA